MAQVGVEPYPESRLVTVSVTHTDPKEAALWVNALGRRLHRVEPREPGGDGQEGLRVAAGAPDRHPGEHARGPEQALQELRGPGPLRARGLGLRGLHLHHQAQRRLHRGPHPAHRHRGGGAAGQGHAGAAGRPWSRSPRWPPTPWWRASTARSRPSPWTSRACSRSSSPRTPRCRRSRPRSSRSGRRARRAARPSWAGLQAEYVQLQKREGELRAAIDGQKSLAASQSRKASELDALKKEAESSKSLYEVLLQKLNESDIAASIRSNNVTVVERASRAAHAGAPREAQDRPRGPAARPGPGRGPGARPRLPRQHPARPRGGGALPPPRPPGRGAPLRVGQRPPRDRGLPEPAHRPPLRPPVRGGPGRPHHGLGAPGGQDHDPREHGQAAGPGGREDGGARLRPAPRAAPPPPGPGARARAHRPLHPPRADHGAAQGPPRSRTSSCSPRARCPPTPPRSWRAGRCRTCSRSCGPGSSGSWWTRRRWPRSPTPCSSPATRTSW